MNLSELWKNTDQQLSKYQVNNTWRKYLFVQQRDRNHKNEPNGNSKTKEQNFCTEKVYRNLQQQTNQMKKSVSIKTGQLKLPNQRKKNGKGNKKSPRLTESHENEQYMHY